MTDAPTPSPRRRWVMPVLFASLAVNLLIVGLVAGAFLSPDGPRNRTAETPREIRGVLGQPFFKALPREDRRAMVRGIVQNREQFVEGREVLRNRVAGFLAAIRAEDFDRAEAERLLGAQREAALRRQNMGEALLLDRLETMTPEERNTYADALEDGLKGFKQR